MIAQTYCDKCKDYAPCKHIEIDDCYTLVPVSQSDIDHNLVNRARIWVRLSPRMA